MIQGLRSDEKKAYKKVHQHLQNETKNIQIIRNSLHHKHNQVKVIHAMGYLVDTK
jgi:hypothetical protein